MNFLKQSLSLVLSCCPVLATVPAGFADPGNQPVSEGPVKTAQQTPEQLQQLVAPIALYPDPLVAQILAAATYSDQIVEADRWLQQHTDLKYREGDAGCHSKTRTGDRTALGEGNATSDLEFSSNSICGLSLESVQPPRRTCHDSQP